MEHSDAILFADQRAWRRWLQKNHRKETEVWLFHYKKGSGKTGVQHEEAVEEALCFGWIDGKLRSVDGEKYALRYTPRRKGSVWSKINKDIAMRMMKEGRMTRFGMEKIAEAKKNGMWDSAYSSRNAPSIPGDLERALAKNDKALRIFQALPNSHQTSYVHWVESSKKDGTRGERIKSVVRRMTQDDERPESSTKWWMNDETLRRARRKVQ